MPHRSFSPNIWPHPEKTDKKFLSLIVRACFKISERSYAAPYFEFIIPSALWVNEVSPSAANLNDSEGILVPAPHMAFCIRKFYVNPVAGNAKFLFNNGAKRL